MNPDLVTLGDDAALLVGMDQPDDRWNVERRLDAVPFEQFEDARHRDPRTVLAPGQPPDRLTAVAQLVGLMVAVERQRNRAPRTAGPFARPQKRPGAHPVDQPAPMLVRPLPRFAIGFRSAHRV